MQGVRLVWLFTIGLFFLLILGTNRNLRAGPEEEGIQVLSLATEPQVAAISPNGTGQASLEVTVFEFNPGSPVQLASARNWANKVLADAVQENPRVDLHLIDTSLPNEPSPGPDALTAGLPHSYRLTRTHYPISDSWQHNVLIPLGTELTLREKLTVAIVRGLLNGGVTTLNLIVSRHVPALLAAPLGIVVGSMCFGFAFMGTRYTDWIAQTGTLRRWLGVDEESRISRLLNQSEPVLKYAVTEIAFISVIRSVMQALGIVHFHSPIEFASDVISTSIPSIAGQGLWDISISRNSLRERADHPSQSHRIRVQTVTQLALISAFSVGTAVLQLTRLPIAKIAFGALIATGAISYARTWYRNRGWVAPVGHPSSRCLRSLKS